MRTWRSPMSVASRGAFVVILEISLCDISYIIKKCTCVIAHASPHEKTVDVKINGFCGAHFRNRTRDTGIFSPLLYLLS